MIRMLLILGQICLSLGETNPIRPVLRQERNELLKTV